MGAAARGEEHPRSAGTSPPPRPPVPARSPAWSWAGERLRRRWLLRKRPVRRSAVPEGHRWAGGAGLVLTVLPAQRGILRGTGLCLGSPREGDRAQAWDDAGQLRKSPKLETCVLRGSYKIDPKGSEETTVWERGQGVISARNNLTKSSLILQLH